MLCRCCAWLECVWSPAVYVVLHVWCCRVTVLYSSVLVSAIVSHYSVLLQHNLLVIVRDIFCTATLCAKRCLMSTEGCAKVLMAY